MKTLIAVLTIAMPAAAQQSYSPYVDRDYPENVYWGDTHVHTYLSADAYGLGTRITPDQAYRFAKGENGMRLVHVWFGPFAAGKK